MPFINRDHISVGRVTACELFAPMAKAAKAAIKSNGYSDAVKVLVKRSDEIAVGKISLKQLHQM